MTTIRRPTRAEQSAENRDRLLAAARAIFTRKGYHASSVEEVAEEAGFSKGAVYSQFGSKDDLLLALLERRIEERARENLEAVTAASGSHPFAGVGQVAERRRRADPGWTLLVLEFRIHAARNPELHARYVALHARSLAGIASVYEEGCRAMSIAPPLPPIEFARLVFALDSGYALEELADPSVDSRIPALAVTRLLGQPDPPHPDE